MNLENGNFKIHLQIYDDNLQGAKLKWSNNYKDENWNLKSYQNHFKKKSSIIINLLLIFNVV